MIMLHQLLALLKGTKERVNTTVTRLHHEVQKGDLITGIIRTYRPKDDDGDRLPDERKIVQLLAENVLRESADEWARLWALLHQLELANQRAAADVVVGGQVLLAGAPATLLIQLEKQLTDVRTFIQKLPVLDPSEVWTFNPDANAWASQPVETTRSKKVPVRFEKAPATDKHPAQVEVYQEDQLVGTWRTIKLSGGLPGTRKKQLLDRVEALLNAVKAARAEANSVQVEDTAATRRLLDYLLAP